MEAIIKDVYSFLSEVNRNKNKLEILNRLLEVLKEDGDDLVYEGLVIENEWKPLEKKRLLDIFKNNEKMIKKIYEVKYNFITENILLFSLN